MVKNLPAAQETQFPSLGQEEPLKEEMATHSSIFCLGNPHGQRSLEGHSPWGHKSQTELRTNTFTFIECTTRTKPNVSDEL